jgi:Family of unknown function (DUF6252)
MDIGTLINHHHLMKKIIIVFSVLFLLISCKKEISELPAATETGANTFGARVDGSLFVPQGFGPFPANDILEARFMPNHDLYINARNFASSPNEKEFEIFIKGVTAPGTYPLNTTTAYPTTTVSYGYYVKRNMTPQNEWITSATYTGSVTITKIDMINYFVSGTFRFNAINLYNTPQPLSVTEGRFDVKTQ